MGRWMSPDWAANATTVPYADFGDPQSLNLYAYVRNSPLSLTDDDGHEIKYAPGLKNSQLVQDTVEAILADPQTRSNLSGYVGPNNPDLVIQSGDLSSKDTRTVSPDDGTVTTETTQGEMVPNISTSRCLSNCGAASTAPESTLTGATITIDNRTSKGDTPGVLLHETTHAGEARKDPAKWQKDEQAERGLPHNKRPQEQRANQVKKDHTKQIKQAVKQIEQNREKKKK